MEQHNYDLADALHSTFIFGWRLHRSRSFRSFIFLRMQHFLLNIYSLVILLFGIFCPVKKLKLKFMSILNDNTNAILPHRRDSGQAIFVRLPSLSSIDVSVSRRLRV